MKKRIAALILTIVLCFGLVGCRAYIEDFILKENTDLPTVSVSPDTDATSSPNESDVPAESTLTESGSPTATPDATPKKESSITPILYKVTDKKGNFLWLLGSVHVGRDDFYPLPDYVMDAFVSSDVLAVECDVIATENDTGALMDAFATLVYTDGTTIKDHIPEDMYNAAVKIMKKEGLYFSAYDYYKPSFWYMFIDSYLYEKIGADSKLGIDRNLLNAAKDAKKEISEIESVKEQYEMLAGFSPKLQEVLLESAIESYNHSEEVKVELEKMLDAWAKGDADYLTATEEPEDPEKAALYEEYIYEMETKRNALMTGYAIKALESGKEVFICVGAAHVLGDSGMAARLDAIGYTVEQIKG